MKIAPAAAMLFHVLFVSIDGGACLARAETLSVSVSASSPSQGDPVLVEARADFPVDKAELAWKGRTVPMTAAGKGRYIALMGVDLGETPGKVPLSVLATTESIVMRSDLELTVVAREFPVQKLTLPKRMAEFDAATLERIRAEAGILEKIFSITSPPEWDMPFLRPVDDFRPTGFGARRVINGEPRSPHAAVDVHLPEGTPVSAIASGTVAFAGDQFFGGRSVVLDHGGGLFSLYYHLREFLVAEGRHVAKGERIGAVGSSGRATGPHLHFGVRAAGGRIDPSRLFGEAFR
jgi:murein DD-endopeptidase MepM/ murein hydrolase activator NlpD